MRNTSEWRQEIVGSLRKQWPENAKMKRAEFCNVELGLELLQTIAPTSDAKSLWVMLTGYSFPEPSGIDRTDSGILNLSNGRRLLSYFRSRFQWEAALRRYQNIEERFRMFDIDADLRRFERRQPSIATNRSDIYQTAIIDPVPYRETKIKWAESGKYALPPNGIARQVNIPEELVFAPPTKHDLGSGLKKNPIKVKWNELVAVAKWMDTIVPRGWEQTIRRVQLEVAIESKLQPSDVLEIDGLAHIIGMVSSGKSTLMDVLTVWAAQNGQKITIVVDDVISALNRAQLFDKLGFKVAPVLGRTNRAKHLKRLHAIIRDEDNSPSPFSETHDHIGFRWLSTVCPLKGLMGFGDANDLDTPCIDLVPLKPESDTDGKDLKSHACPIFKNCPVHNAQRELTEAQIWVSTPAGLVFANVAPQINKEKIRFLELACQRSDLIIVDEADRVQMQFDSIFSPTETLVSPNGGGWLDRVYKTVVDAKATTGRSQLADRAVEKWGKSHHSAQGATNRIAAMLQQEHRIRNWVGQRDYFTGWQLLNRLANILIEGRAEKQKESPESVSLPSCFQEALDDMKFGRFENQLTIFAMRSAQAFDDEHVQNSLKKWLDECDEFSGPFHENELADLATKLEFALLVAFLQSQLNVFIRDWKVAEDPLKLSGEGSNFFFKPPRDYESIIPAAPMGNILAFQYTPAESDDNDAGELSFLRCMGVGRWMLLNLNKLFIDRVDQQNPSVMLLSATSWAGNSPSYDVQVPVSAVLRAPATEVNAIKESAFEFLPFHLNDGTPVRVSGNKGEPRFAALKEIVRNLCMVGSFGASRLERERDQLDVGRKRILLLVGSYDEAAFVREQVQRLRPEWRDQILNLVRDDTDFDGIADDGSESLKRGQVDQLRNRDAWILVAPLLAIERGHNILNDASVAALGAAFFLVRIHPPPDDISFAIQSINRWAIEKYSDANWLRGKLSDDEVTLDSVGDKFRDGAYRKWSELLRLNLIYGSMPPESRDALTWNLLVTIWQVVGRLVRGGQKANIYFCDSAFAPNSAKGETDTAATSLLVGMQHALRPYFEPNSNIDELQREIAQTLYGPFYSALNQIRGIQVG